MQLNGKIAIITGAAKGIGKLSCETLLKAGATVIGVDHNPIENICPDFLANPNFVYILTDLTSEKDILSLFQEVETRFGKLDILLNVAGGFKNKHAIQDTPLDEWNNVCALNLTSAFLMCRGAIPLMRKNGYGRIVNFASAAGVQPVATANVAYAASKAGVVGLTRYLALEVAKDNITVNCVNPTTTLTDRIRKLRTPEEIEKIGNKLPVGRPGLPEDSVNALMFFISEDSSFITGQTMNVMGGVYMS